MVAHHLGQLGVLELRHHPRTVDRVALDDLKLHVGQPTGLVQDGRWRADLADIVKRGRDPHLGHLLSRQSHPLGDRRRMTSDALGMSMGVRVGALKRRGQLSQKLRASL